MVNGSDLSKNNLTGGHKRFLELVYGLSENNNVILVANIKQRLFNTNVRICKIESKEHKYIPKHLCSMYAQIKHLLKIKNNIKYDFAISFSPVTTICYKIAGYKNIISLFRENMIEYQKAVNPSPLRLLYFMIQEVLAVRASNKIIVQCKKDKDDLIKRNIKYCKRISNKIYIQINNVNASWMKYTISNKLRFQDNVVRILFVGNFSDKRKGHALLLPAISKLLDQGYNLQLYIAGKGKELPKFMDQYKEYNQIIFLGHTKDIYKYLKICDFEIVPSLIDSCPNTILEGLNAGIAVYGTNTGGIPDILTSEKYMFAPNSNSIYLFLKNVLDKKLYISDAVNQKNLKEKLTFNWSEKIEQICVM